MFTYNQYIEDVISGAVDAPEYVLKAVQRHVRDCEHGQERGLFFDEARAQMVIVFYHTLLHHWKGSSAGEKVILEPWQQFITASLFGWYKANGFRRFRTAYITVPRKNGKTTWAAGAGLWLLALDGEEGAEVYSAATKKDQAAICHTSASKMVSKSPALGKEIGTFRNNLHHEKSNSKFEPLASDTDSLDGLNIHAFIGDEVHAWKDRKLWDLLDTATGSRDQPMEIAITTAGTNREGICYQLHEYTQKVLDGILDDDGFFGIIWGLDRDAEGKGEWEDGGWQDERLWMKANPNLGISKKLAYMRQNAKRAEGMPANLDSFLRLDLNIWTTAENRWIHPEAWSRLKGVIDLEALQGRACFAGLDLSSTIDISALVLLFPPEEKDDPYIVLPFFWVPEENAAERENRDMVPYLTWARNSFIEMTPGNVIDYDFIEAQILELAEVYDLQEIAYDRWGATKLVTTMMDHGFTMVPFGQGYASMAAPMRELEGLLKGGLLHDGHPVLTWMAHNVVVSSDPAGNMKPDKGKSREKIDGIVAMVMALGRAILHGGGGSIYETQGVMVI